MGLNSVFFTQSSSDRLGGLSSPSADVPQSSVGIPDWAWGQSLPVQGTLWEHQPSELLPAPLAAGSDLEGNLGYLEGDLGYPEVLGLPSELYFSLGLLLNPQSSISVGFLGAGLFSWWHQPPLQGSEGGSRWHPEVCGHGG